MKKNLCEDKSCPNFRRYARYCGHATGQQAKEKKISPQSKKMKVRLTTYKEIAARFKREHPVCQAQLKDVCSGRVSDIHHTRGRIGDNLTDTRYFLSVCRGCHTYLESNPLFARQKGFTLSRHIIDSG